MVRSLRLEYTFFIVFYIYFVLKSCHAYFGYIIKWHKIGIYILTEIDIDN